MKWRFNLIYPHQHNSLCPSLLCLWDMHIHFITIKISIVRVANRFIKPQCSPRHNLSLHSQIDKVWPNINKIHVKNICKIHSKYVITLWHMIDIRCKLGCLLKRTMSPSSRWRSTMSPYLSPSAAFFLLTFKDLQHKTVNSNHHQSKHFHIRKEQEKKKVNPLPFSAIRISEHSGTRVLIRSITDALPQLLNIMMGNTFWIC